MEFKIQDELFNSIKIQKQFDTETLILGAAMSHLFFRKMGLQDRDLANFSKWVLSQTDENELNKIVFGGK